MKIKTNKATGQILDYLVAKALGAKKVEHYEYNGQVFLRAYIDAGVHAPWEPSRYWNQGGPIIEREWLDITPWPNESEEEMRWSCDQHDMATLCRQYGPTPLIAAMRCYVASKLGDEVEVPDELI